MKLKVFILLIALLFLLIFACSSPKQTVQQSPEEIKQMIKDLGLQSGKTVEEDQRGVKPEYRALLLSDYLKRVSGVNIITVGGEISVRIRGITSIKGNNSPLFVVNGSQIGYSYAAAEQSVAVEDIDYISVLKGNEASQRYGSRGTAGVIEIFTKR